jgi:hypothetical protein
MKSAANTHAGTRKTKPAAVSHAAVALAESLVMSHAAGSRSCPPAIQPWDKLPGVRRTLDGPRSSRAAWLHRVVEVLLGHNLIGGPEIPGGKDLVEQPHDESLVVLRQSFPPCKEARYN